MPLQSLIAEATRYARFIMKRSGFMVPVMMAATTEGVILFSPDKMGDTGAKDDFANKVRLITASYAASAVVLIVESWITKARPGEKLDTETPPSESYDREEVVVLIGQSPQGNITQCCPFTGSTTASFGTSAMPKTCPPTASAALCRSAANQARGRQDPPDGQGAAGGHGGKGDAFEGQVRAPRRDQSSNHRFTASGLKRTRFPSLRKGRPCLSRSMET